MIKLWYAQMDQDEVVSINCVFINRSFLSAVDVCVDSVWQAACYSALYNQPRKIILYSVWERKDCAEDKWPYYHLMDSGWSLSWRMEVILTDASRKSADIHLNHTHRTHNHIWYNDIHFTHTRNHLDIMNNVLIL